MKNLMVLLAGLWLGVSAFAQSPTSIVFTWTNNDAGIPACSSTVTSSCLVGQTLTDTTVPSSPAVLSSSISPTASTFTTPLPAFTSANRSYSLVVNYKDSAGAAQATSAVTATVGVPLVVNAPTGFSAKTQ